MAYIARVIYEVRPGHAVQAEEVLCLLRGHTLAEAGCLAYEPHRNPDDPTRLYLYEVYLDEAAYRHHQETEHFARYARGTLGEHVAGRAVERYESIAATPLPSA